MNIHQAQLSKPRCVADVVSDASSRIAEVLGLDKRTAHLEARVLAAFAWDVAQSWLIAHDTDTLNEDQVCYFQTLLGRRMEGEPIAYITGWREFYGRPFHVTPDVLIPRPETELLVELALARIPPGETIEVLELGTGSGCIAISLALERPHARITAVEQSEAALSVAQFNAHVLHADLELVKSDWFRALPHRKFDLIISNPPYVAAADSHLSGGDVRFEPLRALASGKEGMDDLQHIITIAPTYLKAGGSLLLEHGCEQRRAMQDCLHHAGFKGLLTWQDLAARDRVSGGNVSE